ncbi:MAG: DegT/DnrJ/EryC1/StrS family aminotransferase, partial [Candidatus Diapherotrites archaeon]|nr:DegT/DnrJ/EryC1/StrS family aminotransferase [Candidatus Diapherotrites archaeon]
TIKLAESVDRTKFVSCLLGKGIGASVHFDPPIHLQTFYKKSGYAAADLPVTEELSKRIVTLPMFPQMQKKELHYIVEQVAAALHKSMS